ncbi:MAG: hypothetical protein V6010_00650 [Candidatus Dasytiphilus stammeri]
MEYLRFLVIQQCGFSQLGLMLGDLKIAEPKALIIFSGLGIIKPTIR